MYLTLKIDAAEDPVKDISQWKGKLPKDAPTPEQKAEMERQQAQAQQEEQAQKQRLDGLTNLLSRALTKVAEEPPQPVQQPQPQPQPQAEPEQGRLQVIEQQETQDWMNSGRFY
jgi:hypothetical protein